MDINELVNSGPVDGKNFMEWLFELDEDELIPNLVEAISMDSVERGTPVVDFYSFSEGYKSAMRTVRRSWQKRNGG